MFGSNADGLCSLLTLGPVTSLMIADACGDCMLEIDLPKADDIN